MWVQIPQVFLRHESHLFFGGGAVRKVAVYVSLDVLRGLGVCGARFWFLLRDREGFVVGLLARARSDVFVFKSVRDDAVYRLLMMNPGVGDAVLRGGNALVFDSGEFFLMSVREISGILQAVKSRIL